MWRVGVSAKKYFSFQNFHLKLLFVIIPWPESVSMLVLAEVWHMSRVLESRLALGDQIWWADTEDRFVYENGFPRG